MKKRKNKGRNISSIKVTTITFFVGISIFLLFFTVITAMSTTTNEATVTGSAAIQAISYLKAGSQFHSEVKGISGVKEVKIQISEDVKSTTIRFDEVSKVNWEFKGIIFSQFRVSSENAQKFGQIEFLLKIPENDLDKMKIKKEELKLYFNEKELSTVFSRQKDGFVLYSATAPGMGDFVIGSALPILPRQKEAAEEKVPGEEEKEEITAPEQEILEVPVEQKPLPPEPPQEADSAVSKQKLSLLRRIINFFKSLWN